MTRATPIRSVDCLRERGETLGSAATKQDSRILIFAGHFVAAALLLGAVVFPYWESYDKYVTNPSGERMNGLGLLGRYLYATAIAWFLTGPLPFAAAELIHKHGRAGGGSRGGPGLFAENPNAQPPPTTLPSMR